MKTKPFESDRAHLLGEAALPACIAKILVAVDFSPTSKNAFRYAAALANYFHAHLTVVHVVPPLEKGMFAAAYGIPQFSGDDLASGDENLRALADHAALNHTQAMEKILRVGSPAREICEAAKESGADLLVLGSHGSTGWRYFCIGSTAEHVVRAAPCSVLVVREKEHDFGTGAVAPH